MVYIGIEQQTQVSGLHPLIKSEFVVKQVQAGVLEREMNIIPGVESNVRLTRVRGAERSVVVLLICPFRGCAPILIEYRADPESDAGRVRMGTAARFHIPIISTESNSSL